MDGCFCCFSGFLAHLEQKFFLNFFHLATHHCFPLDPLFAATHHRHQPLMHPTAVVDTGGGWHQWWFVVLGSSSGSQRLAVVGGDGWQ